MMTARKTSLKINTGPIVTIFDCYILFAFYIVGKVRYKWIAVRDLKSLKYRELEICGFMLKLSSKL